MNVSRHRINRIENTQTAIDKMVEHPEGLRFVDGPPEDVASENDGCDVLIFKQGGLDGWAASAMLRSPVGWVHTAGAVYGGLTIFVLLLNLSGGVSDLVELRVAAEGTAMKPSGESGLIESKQ